MSLTGVVAVFGVVVVLVTLIIYSPVILVVGTFCANEYRELHRRRQLPVLFNTFYGRVYARGGTQFTISLGQLEDQCRVEATT